MTGSPDDLDRRTLVTATGAALAGTVSGCLSAVRDDSVTLVYVEIQNITEESRTIEIELLADDEVAHEATYDVPSSEAEWDGTGTAPHQVLVRPEWPDAAGEYELVGRLDGVDREFRTTTDGVDGTGYVGFRGSIHPGRNVLGWFVEEIDPDDVPEYRAWVREHAD